MYDPEEFHRTRDRLRAEIEASRTPEEKAEAAQIRAERAAYEALPNSKKTELEELEVFRSFASVSGIEVDPGSELNAPIPEPDICCTIKGHLHYFELGEITDQSVARTTADALKHDEPRGTAFSQTEPFAYIIGKKRTRTYAGNGAPIELVLYYRNQHAPWPSYFSEMLTTSAPALEALVTGGPFQRVWIFDFNKSQVLWHSPAEPTTILPGHNPVQGKQAAKMPIDLSNMEEICCPDCKKPLFAVLDPDNENYYKFEGCPCARREYTLPNCVMFGVGGGPLFFYKEKAPNPTQQP
jgi:hypothetical protein